MAEGTFEFMDLVSAAIFLVTVAVFVSNIAIS